MRGEWEWDWLLVTYVHSSAGPHVRGTLGRTGSSLEVGLSLDVSAEESAVDGATASLEGVYAVSCLAGDVASFPEPGLAMQIELYRADPGLWKRRLGPSDIMPADPSKLKRSWWRWLLASPAMWTVDNEELQRRMDHGDPILVPYRWQDYFAVHHDQDHGSRDDSDSALAVDDENSGDSHAMKAGTVAGLTLLAIGVGRVIRQASRSRRQSDATQDD